MTFVVIVMLLVAAMAFMLIGGQFPQLDNSKVGSPVVIVTPVPGTAQNNLQLITFLGLTVTPAPMQIPTIFLGNPSPTYNIIPTSGTTPTIPMNTPTSPPVAVSCTYYVAKNGKDTNSGTESQPWLTIQKGASTAIAGNTVCVKPGTYYEKVTVQNSGTSPTKWIIFISETPGAAIIDGSNNLPECWGGLFEMYGKSYIKVIGFSIRNSTWAGIWVQGPDSAHIRIENNRIDNTDSSAISSWGEGWQEPSGVPNGAFGIQDIIIDGNDVTRAVTGDDCGGSPAWGEEITMAFGTDGFEVMNNHVHDSVNTDYGGEGIVVKHGSRNGSVHDNIVHDLTRTTMWQAGIYIDAWNRKEYNISIYDNTVYNIAGWGFVIGSEQAANLNEIKLYNNIAYNSNVGLLISSWGHVGQPALTNLNIANNTFYNNGVGIFIQDEVAQAYIRNNIISDNTSSQIKTDTPVAAVVDYNLVNGPTSITGTNAVIGFPIFENATGGIFKLKNRSPAIGAGLNSALLSSYDKAGNKWKNPPSIGAYEY